MHCNDNKCLRPELDNFHKQALNSPECGEFMRLAVSRLRRAAHAWSVGLDFS
jgi:hypothetical protein